VGVRLAPHNQASQVDTDLVCWRFGQQGRSVDICWRLRA